MPRMSARPPKPPRPSKPQAPTPRDGFRFTDFASI